MRAHPITVPVHMQVTIDLPGMVEWVPAYVWDLLDAYLEGHPLNFGGHPVPTAVQQRLTTAFHPAGHAEAG